MIRGVHTMFYTSQPEALRGFLRDKLQLTYTDVGGGWLIFNIPEAEMGCHPADASAAPSGMHYVSFYCDDIQRSVAELKARGVEFVDEISDAGYGFITHFMMPGQVKVQLYQPRYQKTLPPPSKPQRRKPKPAAKKKPTPKAKPSVKAAASKNAKRRR